MMSTRVPSEMDDDALVSLVLTLAEALRARGERLATAESCTGGLIAGACTAVAGSSDWFDRGIVTYSNAAKVELLGVDAGAIDTHGAVSEPVARAMAQGLLDRCDVNLGVAVTGVAGPGGGSALKPVGLVWIATACRRQGIVNVVARSWSFSGDRAAVRRQSVVKALEASIEAVRNLTSYPKG
jgi:nicotinamide-nucleotide amidase